MTAVGAIIALVEGPPKEADPAKADPEAIVRVAMEGPWSGSTGAVVVAPAVWLVRASTSGAGALGAIAGSTELARERLSVGVAAAELDDEGGWGPSGRWIGAIHS